MPVDIKLGSPLKAHNAVVDTIHLRDLTARDMVKMRKSPVSMVMTSTGIGDEMLVERRFDTDYDLAMKYLAELSGYDDLVLSTMRASDFQNCVNALAKMWNDDGPLESSEDKSKSSSSSGSNRTR